MAANNLKKNSKNSSFKKLRIFAASPSDVATERARLKSVVEDLNSGLADHLRIVLEIKEWSQVAPKMGRGQQVIFDQIPVTTWDLMIGILWLKYGTPAGGPNPAESGTHEEFSSAYEMWKQTGKPQIKFYRCTRPLEDITKLNLDDLAKINQFFKEFETGGKHKGLYRTYDTAELFERLVRRHLEDFLIEYSKQELRQPVSPEVVQSFAPKTPNNLPHHAAFFGRAKEMDLVMRALSPADRTWGVLVDGIGGIGKTAIALEAAHRAQDSSAFDAFVFVTAKQNILDPSGIREKTPAARTLDEFLNETARVLGQPKIARKRGDKKHRALLDALRRMRALLIYDNMETLSEEEQEAMANFLRELPQGCKAIITSRRRGGEGAVWLRLEKLDWDAARRIIENQMGCDPRLANKLRCVKSRWQELYDETNGSPLALVHTLGLMRVRAALTFDRALEILRGNRDADLQKFIFQEALKELTENDKTALGALSFFVPSATFEAWIRVANLSHNSLEMTLDRLDALSLLARVNGHEYYELQPVARKFVDDELLAEDAQAKTEMGRRFAEHWVDYAIRFGGSSSNYKGFNQLKLEWKNLYAAAKWLWNKAAVQGNAVGDKDAARRLNDLVRALRQFLLFYGLWDERVELCKWAYEAISRLNDWSSTGWRAYDLAWIHLSRGQINDAKLWADRCSQAWEHGGNKSEQAIKNRLLGLVAEQHKDYETAERLYQEAQQIWRDLKNDEWSALVLDSLGELERIRKHYVTADQHYRDALALAEKLNNKDLQANIAGNFGRLLLDRKRLEEARIWYEKEYQWAKEIGRQSITAESQYGLARVHEEEGRMNLALPLAQKALKIYKRLQHCKLAEAWELVQRLTTVLNKEQN